ncbi:MAG: hypothetical protein BMS9Abin37_0926 [Acidobacteriota bacterium]|nr:MAG: hypothetical protein BMS9Abin37_0926 [Acidobacteriota bacterium]
MYRYNGDMKRFRGMLWPVLLVVLLAVLAWLQFRWTAQISVAEQERMQASLQSSVRRFAGDVDDEAMLLFQFFRVARADELGSRLERYRDEARYPELVSAIYFFDADGGLKKLEGEGVSHELVSIEWPQSLERVRERLSGWRRRAERGRRGGPPFPSPVLSGEPPVVVVPIAPRGAWRGFSSAGYTLATLDSETLRDAIFPELAERHFGPEYDVAVVDGHGDVLFATADGDAAMDPLEARSDARGELFSLGRFMGRSPRRGERRRHPPEIAEARERLGAGRWEVLVRHRAGSLEAFVASTRVRNLMLSFGILGLLAASMALVAVSTRRATELNDRKMEFVAGVSHELRTPVAVLRSAGQNLADGSVSDPAQVKRYGSLIDSEGRRLNDLVDQVLELAGIQSQKRRYRREPVSAESLVADALTDCESLRDIRSVRITTSFPSKGATLLGDPDAMRRAVSNIIMNAIKHGGDGNGNAVEILAEPRGSKIAIVVSDRGPGISEEDQSHLFEPFYRGSRAHERQVPGSGLGLSLVDHVAREHGGSVEVESTPGKGSRFTLYFPAQD